jgi:uncharacterized membrane protein
MHFVDYHEYYDDIYSKCPQTFNISDCPAANVRTTIEGANTYADEDDDYLGEVPAPAPGIIPYPSEPNEVTKYRYWICDLTIIDVKNLTNYARIFHSGEEARMTGICRAGTGYTWGFSFLLTFIVAIMNLVFVLLMYALWLDVLRHHVSHDGDKHKAGYLKDALTMVTTAQQQYGMEIGTWSTRSLSKDIMKGWRGLGHSFSDETEMSLRKRRWN